MSRPLGLEGIHAPFAAPDISSREDYCLNDYPKWKFKPREREVAARGRILRNTSLMPRCLPWAIQSSVVLQAEEMLLLCHYTTMYTYLEHCCMIVVFAG